MGTYGGYMGDCNIPEEKKECFSRQMVRLLHYGGMMRVIREALYGNDVYLMIPVDISQPGDVNIWFNYFEDELWENLVYTYHNGYVYTGKIGGEEFNRVALAAYMLYEVYDEEPGLTLNGSDIENDVRMVGWLNHILDTSFSMKNRFRIWEIAESYACAGADNSEPITVNDLYSIIPKGMAYAAAGPEMTDLLYILGRAAPLFAKDLKPGTYLYDVYVCGKEIESVLTACTETDPEDPIWELLRMQRSEREKIADGELAELAEYSLFLPARVFVYLMAELRGFPFWKVWKARKDEVYHDEQMRQYVSEELLEQRKAWQEAPIAKCRTSDFLRIDEPLFFRNTPKELSGTQDYYLTDDDRLYWWDDQSDEVIISVETDNWLKELAVRHREFMDAMGPDEDRDNESFQKRFVQILCEVNTS